MKSRPAIVTSVLTMVSPEFGLDYDTLGPIGSLPPQKQSAALAIIILKDMDCLQQKHIDAYNAIQ